MWSLRYRLSWPREYLRYRLHHPDRKASFEAIADGVKRERIFLIGNGPSLKSMDLRKLDGEDYILCNLAERMGWTQNRHHPYYIGADARVADGYVDSRPSIDAGVYFLNEALRPEISPSFAKGANIVWFSTAKGGTLKRGLTRRPWVSVAGGQTVLLSAAQIALYLGYKEIYVIGCDLDYASPAPYAYDISAAEQKAYRNEAKMVETTNSAFAMLDQASRQNGQSIANAGIGGNLKSLQRVDFKALFQD